MNALLSSAVDFLCRLTHAWRDAPIGVKFACKLALTIALVGLVVHGLELERIGDSLRRLHPWALAAGVVTGAMFVVIRIGKWALLIGINGFSVPFRPLAKAWLCSLLLGIVTPGRIGEMASVAPFPPEQKKRGIALFFFDRVSDVATVLALSAPALASFVGPWGMAASVLLLFPAVAAMILFGRNQRWRAAVLRLPLMRREWLTALEVQSMYSSGRYWAANFMGQSIAYFMVVCFILGAANVDNWHFVMLLPVISLSNLVSITVGGLGVREGLAALLLPFAGVPAEVGAVAFLLAFIVTRVIPGIVGAAWFVGGMTNARP